MKNRKPIYLDRNTVALVTFFTRPDKLEDIWITDYPEYDENQGDVSREAARQFIDQLEGSWTPRFLKALRIEIDEWLKEFTQK